jgi:cobalt-zinc-cadmium efflux system membrane fusion protein
MSNTNKPGVLQSLFGFLPNVLILGLLVTIGYWGIKHDWKLSSAANTVKDEGTWCGEHNVPRDICVACNPDLLPTGKEYGWCREHGVHECTLCNPALSTVAYNVTNDDRLRAKAALSFAPRQENNRRDQLHLKRLQFGSLESYNKTGIEVVPVRQTNIAETAPVHGEITNDPSRVVHYSSRVPGSVFKVFKHLGDTVQPGDVLALIDAASVGQAKAEYLQAVAQWDVRVKTRNQMQSGVVPEPTIIAADAAVREAKIRVASARQALINLGLPAPEQTSRTEDQLTEHIHFLGLAETITKELDVRTTSNNLLPLRAMTAGTVTSRDVVAGEVVDASKLLFEIVDHSSVWLTVGVRSEEVGRIQLGKTKIRFEPEGYAGEVTAPITWISTEADHKTRLVKVRAELSNPANKLRANTYGHGDLILREEPKALVVPKEALHVENGSRFVFVRNQEFLDERAYKVFHVRMVRIGALDDKYVEIIAGVLPGELVATKNSGLLMAELRRGNIGAGCCGND